MLKDTETAAREYLMWARMWGYFRQVFVFHSDDPLVPLGKYAVISYELKNIDEKETEHDFNAS